MKLNDKIKQRRVELNLTLEQVASAVGVAKSTVKKWEDGQIASMRQSKLLSLAKALRVPPSYLIFPEETIEESFQNAAAQRKGQNTPIDSALSAVCGSLSEEQKAQVLAYAVELLKK